MPEKFAIGVYVEGSHISCTAVDLNTGKIVPETNQKVEIENDSSAGLILMLWSAKLRKTIDLVGKENVKGIGISVPGPFDYVNGVGNFSGVPKYEELRGVNIAHELRDRLSLEETIEIRFINDAIGMTLGEGLINDSDGYTNKIAIILGEGFGSAFVEDGKPVIDAKGVPEKGIIYNLPYKKGIADDYFSARGLLKSYQKQSGVEFHRVKSLVNLYGKDKRIARMFNQFGKRLAEFLLPVFKSFRADVCVFGGRVSLDFHLFEKSFYKCLQKNSCSTKIRITELEDDSFIIGGARLFEEEHWKKISPIIHLLD